MEIRNKYYSLINRGLTINEINEVIDFKNECKLQNNNEYFYLANLLIVDIYINEGLYSDALNITNRNFNDLDKTIYPNIYFSLLERLIYIYILKKNYRTAYKFALEKKDYIDDNDKEQVNRLYLEMAYIQDALNDKSRALSSLMSIIENEPSKEMKGIVLNNLTKLFIDNKDISNAKDYLQKSISYSYEIKDNDAIIYCAYLNAKLYQLENKSKNAIKLFYDIFRNKKEINDEYIGYLNEFLSLLNDNGEYKDAKNLADKYRMSVDKCNDVFLRVDFYKNYLKTNIFMNNSFSNELKKLYEYIASIEETLKKNNEQLIIESNEDDTNKEIRATLLKTVGKIERIINLISYSICTDSERETLFEFSKKLEKEVAFDEAEFIIFNRATFDAYPKFLDSFNKVSTFQYKKERMYEREIAYNDLNGTIIETLISGNHDIQIDFKDTSINVIDPISNKNYLDLKVRYLYATPLTYEGNLYASVIFTSNNVDILDNINLISLKIASRLLEAKLVSIFYQESLRTKKNILQVAMDGLQEGLYYYDINKHKMYLSEQMYAFLDSTSRQIEEEEYIDLIHKEDLKAFLSRKKAIENRENYAIDYRIDLNGQEIPIHEKASPFISKDNKLLFYICTINRVLSSEKAVELTRRKNLTLAPIESINDTLKELKDDEFTLIGFKLTDKSSSNMNKIYQLMFDFSFSFFMKDDILLALSKETDSKRIKTILEKVRKEVDVKIGFVTYPLMHASINNLIPIIEILCNNESLDISILDNENAKLFNKKLYINNCVNDAIKRGNISLLYSNLYNDNVYFGKFIKVNIKGIENSDNIGEYLDLKTLENLEIASLKHLKKDDINVIKISINTLNSLVSDESINKVINKDHTYLCINDLRNINVNIFNKLDKLGYKYFIDQKILNEIPFNGITNCCGVCLNDPNNIDVNNFFIELKKMIISNEYIDGANLLYYDNKFLVNK